MFPYLNVPNGFPFKLIWQIDKKQLVESALCRYRYKVVYAGCRIMPTGAGVAVFQAGFSILCAA
jgi:hypothetical protein